MRQRLAWVGVFALASCTLAAARVSATPITYELTGTGSGTVGSTSFTDAAFDIKATGDTTNRQAFTGGFFIDNTAADITIDALGDFAFTTGTRFFVNNTDSVAGFSRAGITGADLYNFSNPGFATWDMLSSIGPIAISGNLLQWDSGFPAVVTTGGTLVFDSGASRGTFEATVGAAVPEPASLLLLGTGLLGVVRRARRRA